jgi:VanZ family protein
MTRSFWIILTIGCMGAIAFLSLTPNTHPEGEKGKIKEMVDNVGHVPAYAVLCFLWINSLTVMRRRPYLAAIFICIDYGITMEYLQSFVPGRYPSLMDVGSDTLGALITVFIFKRRFNFSRV